MQVTKSFFTLSDVKVGMETADKEISYTVGYPYDQQLPILFGLNFNEK